MRLPMRCYRPLAVGCYLGKEAERLVQGVGTKFRQNIQLQSRNPQAALYSLMYVWSLHVVLFTPHSIAFAP